MFWLVFSFCHRYRVYALLSTPPTRRRRRALFFFFSFFFSSPPTLYFSHSDAISRPLDRVMFYLSTFRAAQYSLCFFHPPAPTPMCRRRDYPFFCARCTTRVPTATYIYIYTHIRSENYHVQKTAAN